MTTTNAKPRTGDVALAYLIAPGRSRKTVMDAALADLRALIAERDDLKERLQGRRNEVQRLEDALHDAVNALAVLSGPPVTYPRTVAAKALAAAKAALAGEGK